MDTRKDTRDHFAYTNPLLRAQLLGKYIHRSREFTTTVDNKPWIEATTHEVHGQGTGSMPYGPAKTKFEEHTREDSISYLVRYRNRILIWKFGADTYFIPEAIDAMHDDAFKAVIDSMSYTSNWVAVPAIGGTP